VAEADGADLFLTRRRLLFPALLFPGTAEDAEDTMAAVAVLAPLPPPPLLTLLRVFIVSTIVL
jgi:hypothetical protein